MLGRSYSRLPDAIYNPRPGPAVATLVAATVAVRAFFCLPPGKDRMRTMKVHKITVCGGGKGAPALRPIAACNLSSMKEDEA